jgi:hypothetical protein
MNLKTVLITISIIAGILVVITFYVVFYSGGGTYVVSSDLSGNSGIFSTSSPNPASSTSAFASSTPTSTLAFGTSTASSTNASGTTFSTNGETPNVTWTEGNETMSVTNAMISGTQLTLGIQVVMGSVSECVPLNLRLIADEEGDLSPPITSQFTFPDTGTCNGTPGETYSAQPVVFSLTDPGVFPIILTTGGTANTLFEVNQNSDGSLSVQLPPQSG